MKDIASLKVRIVVRPRGFGWKLKVLAAIAFLFGFAIGLDQEIK